MIDLDRIRSARVETNPYQWAAIDALYSPADARALARSFPTDRFKRLWEYGGKKDYEFHARELIGMGAASVSHPDTLSPQWQALASDLNSPTYREAMSTLTGLDLSAAPLEVNVFHYPPGSVHGPHPDLRDKLVTHVLYFNETWSDDDGGCLAILKSSDAADIHRTVSPRVGNSAVLVRSSDSWHAVTPVAAQSRVSRRSVTAVFYQPGSVSTMWPPGDATPLHEYPDSGIGARFRSALLSLFGRG
ncbi:MAG: 2OG-Fe(II) oxygenase [Thermoanaerobaculia bacterium]|jgi:Rps23 Pro-64 3,4-dihydroxylase Tpa1-like proline 4-hydroxylase